MKRYSPQSESILRYTWLLLFLGGIMPALHAQQRSPIDAALFRTVDRAVIASLPAAQWQVKAAPGDTVSVSEERGLLKVTFDVDVRQETILGCAPIKQATFQVRLLQPVRLADDIGRMTYWVYNPQCLPAREYQLSSPRNDVRPVIRDVSGEEIQYTAWTMPQVLPPYALTDNWFYMTTRYFNANEAGALNDTVGEAFGGDKNAHPDGPLAFQGFAVRVIREQFGRAQGTLYIAKVAGQAMDYGFTRPFFTVRNLMAKLPSGAYTLEWTATDRYQGPIYRQGKIPLTYAKDDLLSGLRTLSFPLEENGNYWLECQLKDASGTVVSTLTPRVLVTAGEPPTTRRYRDTREEPLIGQLDIQAGDCGVFARNEPMQLTVRVWPKGKKNLTLKYDVHTYDLYTLMKEQRVPVTVGTGSQEVRIPVTPREDIDAYILNVALLEGEKTIDSRRLIFGRTSLLDPRPFTYRDKAPTVADVFGKQRSFFPVTVNAGSDGLQHAELYNSSPETWAMLLHQIPEALQLSRDLRFYIEIGAFNPLPGVYNYSLTDRYIAEVYRRGGTTTFSLNNYNKAITWLPRELAQSYDGAPNQSFTPDSATNAAYVQVAKDAWKALVLRYRNHPGLLGYHFWGISFEQVFNDQPWCGSNMGYEASAQQAFRQYLQGELHLTLPGLNARWKTAYTDWAQVRAPRPRYELGFTPDLSPEWMDFCRFKNSVEVRWTKEMGSLIRSLDDRRYVLSHCWPFDPEVTGRAVDGNECGSTLPQGFAFAFKSWVRNGQQFVTEPWWPFGWGYGDPYYLDAGIFTAMWATGGNGAHVHTYFAARLFKNDEYLQMFASTPTYDRLQRFKPLIQELRTTQLATSAQVAKYTDPNTLYAIHKTNFHARMGELGFFHNWFEKDGVSACDWDPKETYKLVVISPLSEVMDAAHVTAAVAHVQRGGKLLITANTGRYCPEQPDARFVLLKALGITPPQGPWVTTDTQVFAAVGENNPLFEVGRKIQFYTRRDMEADFYGEKGQKHFWDWAYRWLSINDYFGYYRENKETNGAVLARFPSGAPAMTLHTVGQGQVFVFWGTPNYDGEQLAGMFKRAAAWAGVEKDIDGPLGTAFELHSDDPPRHYLLAYNYDLHGKTTQTAPQQLMEKFLHMPDGQWVLEELVTDCKMGLYSGQEIRERGVPLTFVRGQSPLRVIRCTRVTDARGWPVYKLHDALRQAQ